MDHLGLTAPQPRFALIPSRSVFPVFSAAEAALEPPPASASGHGNPRCPWHALQMCGFCAIVSGIPHWTEAGSDAASGTLPDARDRRLERLYRAKLVNAVIAHYGCAIEDWAMGEYIVRSQRGRTEIVPALPQVWQTVESIAGRPVDPLDPALLERLGALASP